MIKKMKLFDNIFKKMGMKIYDFEDIDECLRALRDKDPDIRMKALEAISKKEDILSISPIVSIMKEDENFQVQEAAMEALGNLRKKEAVEPLIEMLKAQDHWLRVKAAMVLAIIGDKKALHFIREASETLKGEYKVTIDRVISKFEERDKLGKGYVISRQEDEGEQIAKPEPYKLDEKEIQKKDIERDQDDKLIENLRFQLSRASASNANENILNLYFKALTKDDVVAEKALCSYLNDPSETMRFQALQALTGLTRKPHIISTVLENLNDSSEEMCWRSIVLLCGANDIKIGERLLNYIAHENVKIKKYSHSYFVINGCLEQIELLMKDYESADEKSKIERASLIARMDIDDVKHSLCKILQDPKQTEKIITSIIDKLPPRQSDLIAWSLPMLIRRREENIVEAVTRFIKDSNNLLLLEYLRQNLSSNSEMLRGRAAFLLGHLKDNHSAQAIAKLMQDPSHYVRLKAGKALFLLKIEESNKMFFALARKDPNLRNRLEFIQIIDQLYGENALDLFIELIDEKSSEIRCLVIDILSRKTWSENEKKRIQDCIMPLLEDQDMRVFFYVIVLLVKLEIFNIPADKKRIMAVLWTVIKEERNPSKIRKEALYAIFHISKTDAKEVLKNIIKNDPDEEMRVQAAVYLGEYVGRDVEEVLIQAVNSQTRNVVKAAKVSIKKLQSALI